MRKLANDPVAEKRLTRRPEAYVFNVISALHYARRELTIGFVSELCHIPPGNPGQHRHLRGHTEAARCCRKLLIVNALVELGVRQHA